MTDRANLFAALVKAQQSVQPVEKDSKNSYHNYRYASSEDVIGESRRALSSNGLAFAGTSYRVVNGEHGMMLHASYVLAHESGECMEVHSETPIIPEKGRPEDKATATAETYNLAYALRGLLLIERIEEDANADARDDRGYEPRQRQQERKPAKKREPKSPPASEIQNEAKASAGTDWPTARQRWIDTLGRQLFADCVGVDAELVDDYEPPADPKERAALKAVLERARTDLESEGRAA